MGNNYFVGFYSFSYGSSISLGLLFDGGSGVYFPGDLDAERCNGETDGFWLGGSWERQHNPMGLGLAICICCFDFCSNHPMALMFP